MQSLLIKSRNVLKKIKIRSSYNLSALKNDSRFEARFSEDGNTAQNAMDINLERIYCNTDIIEVARYEHYFKLSDFQNSKLLPNKLKKIDTATSFLKSRSFEILDGIQVIMTQTTLPTKINEVAKIVDFKLRQIYPDYVSNQNSDINTAVANQFIADVISNTKINAAYIDVSLKIGLFDRAFKFMKRIRTENNLPTCITTRSMIVDSVFYEPVIFILAKNGKLDAIMNLFSEMDSVHLSPNISIIFAALEAVGRKELINKENAQKLISYINEKQISLKEAFLQATISKDNFSYIVNAICTVDSNFTIEVTEPLNEARSNSVNTFNKEFDAQLELEIRGNTAIESSGNGEVDNDLLSKVIEIEKEWKNDLYVGLKRRQNLLNGSDRTQLYPFMTALSDETYVNVMLAVLYRCMADTSLQFSSVINIYDTIGTIIENHYHYRLLKKNKYFSRLKLVYLRFLKKLEKNPKNVNFDKLWQDSIFENISNGNLQLKSVAWDQKLKSRIGRLIYEIMFENLNVTISNRGVETVTPVLYEEMVEEVDQCFAVARVQWKVTHLFKVTNRVSLGFAAYDLPMLHPPIPIYDSHNTSYFYVSNYATRFIRKSSNLELYDSDLLQPGDISKIYNALNVLSLCQWKVDTENLDLVMEIFNNKGSDKLKVPLRPEDIDIPRKPVDISDYKKYLEYLKLLSDYKKEKAEMFSLRQTLFYKINIAQQFRDKQFWFPYSMDFRGRVYPSPAHLNHIGDDTTRGLLKFGKGKKLGLNGLDWLKIHLINVYGLHKKSSNADRLKAANGSLSEIIDSVLHPLDGRKWWQESEKPWQTLAACREIFNALKFSDETGKGSSDNFISHLGVQQDGSCNGLQHYAALGRDEEGAKVVNLIDMNTPQDVYSDVLKYVNEKIDLDAAKDVEEAKDLRGLVNRKVIKQTVMTTVYGVTHIGAKDQIQRQLKELDALPKEKLIKCSMYLSKIVLSSIGEIFSSATKIKNWFVEMASFVAKSRDANMSWKTPLNLIVTQPYFKGNASNFMQPDSRKNSNAFPPNFIHSLDSTHMMMTALECRKNDVTFVSVHDCFWTHACDVDNMNKICREQFVELYKMPILENLSEYLFNKYGFPEDGITKSQQRFNFLCKKIPKQGSYDIKNVLKSTYFFS